MDNINILKLPICDMLSKLYHALAGMVLEEHRKSIFVHPPVTLCGYSSYNTYCQNSSILGMQEDTSEVTILIRPKLLIFSLDLPTKAIVSNMKQFNMKSSFRLFLGTPRPGQPMLRFYPLNTDSSIRTHQSLVNDAMLFDVTKARMKLWCHAKNKDRSFFIGNQIPLLDKRFQKINIPDCVSRRQSTIAVPTHWKDVASKLPVKEKSKVVTFSEVSLVESVMSEVPMFTVMDETEKENKCKKVNDGEKLDIHEENPVNRSSFSSEVNEMIDSSPFLINYVVDHLSDNDSVEPLSVNAFVDSLLIKESIKHLLINDSVQPLSNHDSEDPLSINDFEEPLLIDDFEENRDCGLTANGNILKLCTDTSIRRVLEIDSNVSQIGHCIGQTEENSIRDEKVWSNPEYHIMLVTKNDEVYSSDKLSQDFDSNKSNMSAISSGCCSINSNQQGVQACRFEFTVSSSEYSTELSKQPKSSSISDDFLPFHIHFGESVISSTGGEDLQKEQANKSIDIKYSDEEEYLKKCRKHLQDNKIAKIVKKSFIELERKRVTGISQTSKSQKKCNRKYKKQRISRRRLRRIIFSTQGKSPKSLEIQVRPVQNSPQLRTTSNELNTSHPSQNETNLSLQQQNSVQSVLPVHNISTYIRHGGSSDLVSESSLTTPSAASSSSWANYFNRMLMGYEYSLEEKMQYEWLRVQSFQDFPVTCHVSPLRLARIGFFSTGNNDEVKCFSCGVKYKNWTKKDNPIGVHHRISIECRMVNGRETKNIPIISEINGLAASNVQQESSQSLFTHDILPSTIHQDEDESIQTTEGALNRSMTIEDIQSSNVADITSQFLNQNLQPHVVQDARRQPVVDRDHSVLDGEQNRTEDKSKEEYLSIYFERPKYPAYAQLSVRVSTFQGWPGYLEQEPRDMALAGLFYEGCNDYCRCFFCGGGLSDWEAGDDPWVEHARWFSKCAFVRQNRGHRFVEIITKRQAGMQAANNFSDIAENQTAVSNQSKKEDRTQINSQETSATPMITQSETNTAVVSENIANTALLLPQPSQQPVIQPSVRTTTRQPATEIMQASAAETSHQSMTVTTFETAFDTASATDRISGQASAINDNEGSSLKEDNTQYKEQGICKTCNSNNVPVAFLPCGHIDCCKDCASAMLKCPMCKVDIKQSLKRKVAVSSQRNLQQMGEIQNYICPSEEDIIIQNTQQSVLNNSESSFEIQQLCRESEFHLGNTIPIIKPVHGQLSDDGSSVQRMCDDNTLSQNQNNFEGLPLIIQGSSVSSQFDNTCTIDTPLMIMFFQMFTNENLYQLFVNSIYDIFRFELPNLLSLLMRRDFDDVRRVWSEIIGHRGRRNFYGSDANFVMDPFSSLLLYHYRFNCTNFKCPTNERSFDMPGLTLPQIPIGEVLNVSTFQQLINNFASQLQCPCNEHIVQTVYDSREENARYTYVPCRGQLSISRTLVDIPEPPPMIIINMGQSGLRRRNIGNLNGTVQIGSHRYYIGGLTFAANDHFMGRILLPHLGRTLLYCNGQGVICNNEEHQDSLLSLIILFRIM